MKKLSVTHLCLIIAMGISAIIILYLSTLKEGMHVDEYYSYGLANRMADGQINITPMYGEKIDAEEFFSDYFYTDSFNIKNVWLNQSSDVHPPIYYLLFHIWGLITGNFLRLKTGIFLNLLFHFLNIGLVYIIIKKMLNDDKFALLGGVLYCFTPIVLGNVIFVRMYTLFTVWVLCLLYLLISNWQSRETGKKFYLLLGGISVVGTLTHYYFLIYLFYCCLIWGIYLVVQRKWQEIMVFCGTMLGAGVVSVAIFPAMINHIFFGYRGKESFANLKDSSIIETLISFTKSVNHLYSGFLLIVVLVVFFLFVFKYCSIKSILGIKTSSLPIGLIPAFLYVITVAKIAVKTSGRYISPIYPIAIIALILLIEKVSRDIKSEKNKYILCIVIIGILINNGWNIYKWPELYADAAEGIEIARSYGVNNECIYVSNPNTVWRSMTSYQEFIQYQCMSFIPKNELELLEKDEYTQYDHVVVYFDKKLETDIDYILEVIIEKNPDLESATKLYEYSYNVAYYLE